MKKREEEKRERAVGWLGQRDKNNIRRIPGGGHKKMKRKKKEKKERRKKRENRRETRRRNEYQKESNRRREWREREKMKREREKVKDNMEKTRGSLRKRGEYYHQWPASPRHCIITIRIMMRLSTFYSDLLFFLNIITKYRLLLTA